MINFSKFLKPENENKILLALLLFGLIIRLYGLGLPLNDIYDTRQGLTAMVSRNFYENNFNILFPQIDNQGLPGYYAQEFQIYPLIVSILYIFFGIHEFLGRLVSIAFFLGSSVLLFKLAKKFFGTKTAFFSIFFFIISPLNIIISQTFMPEPAMIFFSIASIYFFTNWAEKGGKKNYFLAAFCTAMAFLVKITSMLLIFPLFFIAWQKYGKKMFLQPKLWLFAVIILIPLILWAMQSNYLAMNFPTTYLGAFYGQDKFLDIETIKSPQFYQNIFNSVAGITLTPIGFALALFGIFLKFRENRAKVFYFWLFGVLLYFIIVGKGNMIHMYYQLPLVPIAAIFIGLALSKLSDKSILSQTFAEKKIFLTAFFALWLLISAFYALPYTNADYPQDVVAASEVKQLTSKEDLLYVLGRVSFTYYLERKSYSDVPATGTEILIQRFNLAIEKGVKYFVVAPKDIINDFYENKGFSDYVLKKYPVLKKTENALIFELQKNH